MTTPRNIEFAAMDLETLLQAVLDSLVSVEQEPHGDTWLVGFSADVGSTDALVPAVLEEIETTTDEQNACVIRGEVSGVVQGTDEGIRAWGTIELARDSGSRGARVRLQPGSLVRTDNGHWLLNVRRENGNES